MLSRPHQRHGWLFLQRADWARTLERLLDERDRMDDITYSGPPPAWIEWVDTEQMPRLAQDPRYQQQFRNRITEQELKLANLERDIAGGRHDLEPAAALTRKEINWLSELIGVAA